MFSSRPHLIWLPDQRLPSWSLSPESILLSFICSTGLQNNQKSHTGVIYSVFTPTRGVADDRKWDEGGQIKKHGEIETTPLWIKYLCLHIFHTCTSVSTECTILWPCNKVIWSLSHTHTHDPWEGNVLYSKSHFCQDNTSFAAEFLSLWFWRHVPPVFRTSATLGSNRTINSDIYTKYIKHAVPIPPICL